MKGYFKPNTQRAIKLATFIKGITASMATMAFMTDRPNLLFTIMIVGAIANETINFLSDASDPNSKI
jgi:hypothetical protein